MKPIIILACMMLAGCAADTTRTNYSLHLPPPTEFNWMPNPLQWQHNVRDCRSQPQCDPADLFSRW